jgi:hypothetical protein
MGYGLEKNSRLEENTLRKNMLRASLVGCNGYYIVI